MIRIVAKVFFSIISVEEAGEYDEAPNVENQNPNKSGGEAETSQAYKRPARARRFLDSGGEAETLPSGFEGWDFWDEEKVDGEKRPISKGIVETSDRLDSDWSFLNACLDEGRYDFESCLEVLRTWVRRAMGGYQESPRPNVRCVKDEPVRG